MIINLNTPPFINPPKNQKGKKLTSEQIENNQAISKERIRVEHSIGGVKVFFILSLIITAFAIIELAGS